MNDISILIFNFFIFFISIIFILYDFYFNIDYAKRILLIIAKIITNFFTELSMWIIIDRFSPNYTPLIIIGDEICNLINDLITTKNFLKMNINISE